MSEHSSETKPSTAGFTAADALPEGSDQKAAAKESPDDESFDDDCGDSSGGGKS